MTRAISSMMPRIASAAASTMMKPSSTLGFSVSRQDRMNQPPPQRDRNDHHERVIRDVADDLDDQIHLERASGRGVDGFQIVDQGSQFVGHVDPFPRTGLDLVSDTRDDKVIHKFTGQTQ